MTRYLPVLLFVGACTVETQDADEESTTETGALCGSHGKTQICHATGSATQPFTLITVSNRALRAHRHHGDMIPAPPEGCPGDTPPPPVCTPGSTAPCYDGPAGTEGVGTCTSGTMTCNADGSGYGECEGSTAPVAEACGDGIDGDCDGVADEGCVCEAGSVSPCYAGPPGTEDVGACRAGTALCNATGTGLETCTGAVEPVAEVCGDGMDDDCDGSVDNGCGTSITGLAWFDSGIHLRGVVSSRDQPYGNGVQNEKELGIPNIPIRLETSAGTLVASTLTDANGIYSFTGVAPGDYHLKAPGAPNYNPAPGAPLPVVVIATPNLNSDNDHHVVDSIRYAGFNLTTDFVNGCASGVAFRFFPSSPQDGQGPLPGLPIRLKTSTGTLIASTLTDASGNYAFECVPPGEYYVDATFIADLGVLRFFFLSATFQNIGADDTRDSDFPLNDFTTGAIRTADFEVTETAQVARFDVGYGIFVD